MIVMNAPFMGQFLEVTFISPKSSDYVHRDKAYQMLAEVMWLRLSTLDISILEKTIRLDPSGLV